MKRSRVLHVFVLSGAMLAQSSAARALTIPDKFTNLKVLPKDIGKDELISTMRAFSSALDVRCGFCHARTGQGPQADFDWASDEKPEKETARVMMQMVHTINTKQIPRITTKEPGRVEVRCRTCHHGQARPFLVEDLLIPAYQAGGIDSLSARYAEVRDEHYGSDAYNLGETMLPELAERIAGDDPRKMLAIAELNLKYFPNSGSAYVMMGHVHSMMGRKDEAIADLKKAMELDPKVKRDAQRMIDEIQAK